MFKFLVLGVFLCLEIYEISGETQNELAIASSPADKDNEKAFAQLIQHNNDKELKEPEELQESEEPKVRSDYNVTMGIGAYKLHLVERSWNEAKNICMTEGGHLAVIRSDKEAQTISSLMFKDSVDRAWVGYHDFFEEGNWVTIFNETVANLTWVPWSWDIGPNPNNAGGSEHCAEFIRVKGGTNDNNCEKLFPFVCKITI